MKRALLLVTALILLAALGVGGALLLLRDDTRAPAPEVPGAPAPAADADGQVELGSERISDNEERRRRLRQPWPFRDFMDDIGKVRRPGQHTVFRKRQAIETAHFTLMANHKVTIRMENVRVPEVVAELAPQYEPLGLRVYTQDPPVPEQIVFERLFLTDATIQQVISAMKVMSEGLVDYAVTPLGLCIGSKPACHQARIDALDWEVRVRSEAEQPADDAFLDVEYRPDFSGAHIGAIIDDIRGKTGVQVVTDEEAWALPVSISWRTDPLPLRVALRGIAAEMGVGLHVDRRRVFLLRS